MTEPDNGMDARRERGEREKIRAISSHPSGIMIKHEGERERERVMDGRDDMISWGKDKQEDV